MSYFTKSKDNSEPSAKILQQNTVDNAIQDGRVSTAVALQRQDMMANSPVQKKMHETSQLMANHVAPIQRAEDEELLQGKFEAAQRVEDEELLQGKFETAQRVEDEELLQGKFETVQRVEEEELLQGKFNPLQRESIEEEGSLQGKFASGSSTRLAEKEPATFNNTGLPHQLKAGIESLSGMSMDHVKVHYNSNKPAQLNAHAYAQGNEIHLSTGQEQHLPHEAWHVVQQAQGRVKPTMQMKGSMLVNDDVALESEADVMGAKAASIKTTKLTGATQFIPNNAINKSIQRKLFINNSRKYAIPTRDEDPNLITAADTRHVPEEEITLTLTRWMTKVKDYSFPSWKWAFDEAAKGKLKTARGNEEKIKALSDRRDQELNAIEDEAFKKQLSEASKQMQSEQELLDWESKSGARELVGKLKKFAGGGRDRVASVVVDPATLEIKGKGRSGDLSGKRNRNGEVEIDGADQRLVNRLRQLGAKQEDWDVWNCGEVSAAQNAFSLGDTYVGRCFLAGEKGGGIGP